MNPDPDKAYDEMREDQALMYLENEPERRSKMETKFEDLVKIGVMTRAQAESLAALSVALDMIENIGPRVARDRQAETGENSPLED